MKEISEKYNLSTHIDELIIETNDGVRYVFLELPWYDYPVFTHRWYPRDNGTRSFVNKLPTKIKEYMYEEYGGYCEMKVNPNEQPMEDILF